AQHDVLARSLGLAPGQIDLTTLPVFVLANLASGVTSVLPDADLRAPGQIEAAPVVAQLHAHRVTRTAASPGLLARLVDHAERTRQSLPLRTIHVGGAPVFPPFLDRLAQAAPAAAVVAVYGSTEAEPIAEIDRRAMSAADRQRMRDGGGLLAGVPVPEIALRVVAEPWHSAPIGALSAAQFERRWAATGQPGEIVVHGAHVLPGYLGGRGDAEAKFGVDGCVWHRTGDAGTLDAAGRLWLLGRCSARVEDADGALYPFSVECAAVHCAGVARAAFTTHEGRRVLLVQPAPGVVVDLTAVAAAVGWARVREVRAYPVIPVDRRHNAKVDYPALPALLRTRPSRQLVVSEP
ncbi:MAG: AMP-binding protein, partial [Acidobacteriota bacterium]